MFRRCSGGPRSARSFIGGLPLIAGPAVFFQHGWEHDGFPWVLVRQDALAPVEAAADRRNNARVVLHPIVDLDWSSGRWSQKPKTVCEFYQSSTHRRIRSDEKGEEYRTRFTNYWERYGMGKNGTQSWIVISRGVDQHVTKLLEENKKPITTKKWQPVRGNQWH